MRNIDSWVAKLWLFGIVALIALIFIASYALADPTAAPLSTIGGILR